MSARVIWVVREAGLGAQRQVARPRAAGRQAPAPVRQPARTATTSPPGRPGRSGRPGAGARGARVDTRPRVRMTGAQRRQQLIDVGRELFGRRGYEATSIEELAARAVGEQARGLRALRRQGGALRRRRRAGDAAACSTGSPPRCPPAGTPGSCSSGRPWCCSTTSRTTPTASGCSPGTRRSPTRRGTTPRCSARRAHEVEHLLAAQFRRTATTRALAGLYSQALVGMVALVGAWWLEDRSPGQARGGRAPGEPGLERHGPPRRRTRRPASTATARPLSPGSDAGGRRARGRAPRAPSGTPRAGELGGQPARRRPRRRASAATVGPEPLTSAAAAPAAVAASSARRSSGRRASAGACRSLARAGGQRLRRAAAQRGEHRVRRGQLRRRRAPGPSARSRSSSRVDGRGGQTLPRDAEHPVPRPPGEHRG